MQDVFDRFAAERLTSLTGTLSYADLSVRFEDLVVALEATGGPEQYSTHVLNDGSFVLPGIKAGQYRIRVTGGKAKAEDGLLVTLAEGQHVQLTVSLQRSDASTAAPVAADEPTGLSPIAAPQVTKPAKLSELLSGNVLEEILPQLAGVDYRVELIGMRRAVSTLKAMADLLFCPTKRMPMSYTTTWSCPIPSRA